MPAWSFRTRDERSLSLSTRMHMRMTLYMLREHHTILLIAHRLSTVRSADLIAVVDNGHVVEVGSHTSLLGRRERIQGLSRHN
jgi:ABC-type transport system involved in Fe-S cluster assembly fused permease/ATPase subunit